VLPVRDVGVEKLIGFLRVARVIRCYFGVP